MDDPGGIILKIILPILESYSSTLSLVIPISFLLIIKKGKPMPKQWSFPFSG